MDGRENENKNSAAAPQPIFTPPTSGDESEKSQNTSLAPVASTPAVVAPEPFASSAQGDIILSNSSQKTEINKRPIIIGLFAIIIIAIIAVAIGLLIALFSKPSSKDVLKSFQKYSNYIEYGVENPNPDELDSAAGDRTWEIFDLSDLGFTADEQVNFATKSEELYLDFSKKVEKSKIIYDGFVSDNFQEDLYIYDQLLNCILNYNNMQLYSDQLLSEYLANGEDGAREMISNFVHSGLSVSDLGADSSLTDTILANIRQYYLNQISLFKYYSENNCITDGQLSGLCVSLIRDANYSTIQDNNARINRGLEYTYNSIISQFKSYTTRIESILEEKNER